MYLAKNGFFNYGIFGNKSSRADKGINLDIFPYDRAGKDNTIGTNFGMVPDKGTHFIST